MERLDPEETSRKRLKVSQEPDASSTAQSLNDTPDTPSSQLQLTENLPTRNSASAENAQRMKEEEVGITHFVSPDISGFSGILKKRLALAIFGLSACLHLDANNYRHFYRYTDFLVNEIVPSGEVLHLRSLKAPPNSSVSKKPQNEEPPAEPPSKPEPIPEQPSKDKTHEEDGNNNNQQSQGSSGEATGKESEFQVCRVELLAVLQPLTERTVSSLRRTTRSWNLISERKRCKKSLNCINKP